MVVAVCPGYLKYLAGTKSHKALLLLVVCVLTLILCPSLYGQATGSFSGNVLDKSGAGVAGATVIATSQGTGVARNTKADTAGHYLIPLLAVGTYTVRVDASGFQSAESRDLHLQVDEARELDFSLVTRYRSHNRGSHRRGGSCGNSQPLARPGDHLAAGVATALEWPRLCSTGHAHRRRHGRDQSQQLFHLRQRQRGGCARFLLAFRGRLAAQQHGLAAGRCRQQRTDRGRHRHLFFDRRHCGVQGSHLHLLRRIRHPCRTDGAGHAQSPGPTTFTVLSSSLCATPISMPRATLPPRRRSST